jgi:hypothetical protein
VGFITSTAANNKSRTKGEEEEHEDYETGQQGEIVG